MPLASPGSGMADDLRRAGGIAAVDEGMRLRISAVLGSGVSHWNATAAKGDGERRRCALRRTRGGEDRFTATGSSEPARASWLRRGCVRGILSTASGTPGRGELWRRRRRCARGPVARTGRPDDPHAPRARPSPCPAGPTATRACGAQRCGRTSWRRCLWPRRNAAAGPRPVRAPSQPDPVPVPAQQHRNGMRDARHRRAQRLRPRIAWRRPHPRRDPPGLLDVPRIRQDQRRRRQHRRGTGRLLHRRAGGRRRRAAARPPAGRPPAAAAQRRCPGR